MVSISKIILLNSRLLAFALLSIPLISCDKDSEVDLTDGRSGVESEIKWEASKRRIPIKTYGGLTVEESIEQIRKELGEWDGMDEVSRQYLLQKIYAFLINQDEYVIETDLVDEMAGRGSKEREEGQTDHSGKAMDQ